MLFSGRLAIASPYSTTRVSTKRRVVKTYPLALGPLGFAILGVVVRHQGIAGMFLRRCQRRKDGKVHTYWALVESYRTAKGSRQRIVTYLGELKASERSGWAELGRHLDRRQRPQPSLFDPPIVDEPADDEPVLVNLKGVRLERLRDFGDVWLALGLWRLVGLDVVLEQLLPKGREDVPWPLVVAILVIARFCEPSSELHIEHTWYRRSALEELLGVPIAKIYTDRLYEGLDRVLPQKPALEKHLKERLGNLFDLKYDLLLYDVTSTYFEGQCRGNPKAQRGYSRDSRPDCLQVCIGLVVTEEGIPLGYEVFARQYPRQQNHPGHRRGHGSEVRSSAAYLGVGPRHGQREESDVLARPRRPSTSSARPKRCSANSRAPWPKAIGTPCRMVWKSSW